MVHYNRETGLFEHEIYKTVNPRESSIIMERLEKADIPFKLYGLPAPDKGVIDIICIVAENIEELEKYIKEAEKIIQEFLKEEEVKERLAEELNKKLAKDNK